MPASQIARGGVLVAAVVLFVTGAISLAFVNGSGGPSPRATPTSTSIGRSTTTAPPPPPTTAPATAPTTAPAVATTTAPSASTTTVARSAPGTAAPGSPASPSTGSHTLAGTGFDSNVAFLASLSMLTGLLIIWLEERTRILGLVRRGRPSKARPAPYRARHMAPKP